jgi:hypothetical protein
MLPFSEAERVDVPSEVPRRNGAAPHITTTIFPLAWFASITRCASRISSKRNMRSESGDLQVCVHYNFDIQPAMARPISSGESS